ncbi:hypothetical protein JOY44_04975 [Phormidium sp. CLA17]|uniref:hypothetical protein n=1 Tax=Leptolyngbya sp. Cla-17 TaxID=2803751 RepID=UPI001490C8CE|nr:hypothetical protein [Leptolyngbya sp. Cla-17]MBM0740976.1 hypothetical protein [Leptolyngbya sp. Cla-17]
MSDSLLNRYSAIIHAIAITSALAIVSGAVPSNLASLKNLQAFHIDLQTIQR